MKRVWKKKRWILTVMMIVLLFMGVIPAQAASTKWKKACSAYRSYLAKNESKFVVRPDVLYRNSESYTKTSCFMISDLDKNGVPELITRHCWGFRNDSLFVYTYKNGKVIRLKDTKGRYAEISECSWANGGYYSWACNKNHLHVEWCGFSGESIRIYTVSGGKLKLYKEGSLNRLGQKPQYTVNKKKVSKSKYDQEINKCKKTSKGVLRGNTKSIRKRYLI